MAQQNFIRFVNNRCNLSSSFLIKYLLPIRLIKYRINLGLNEESIISRQRA